MRTFPAIQLDLFGIYTQTDVKRLGEGYKRVFDLMKDSQWRTPEEIAELSHTRLDSALRFLRYAKAQGHGYHKRSLGKGLYIYRIIPL